VDGPDRRIAGTSGTVPRRQVGAWAGGVLAPGDDGMLMAKVDTVRRVVGTVPAGYVPGVSMAA
jgi:hypothetical protein